MFIRAGVRGGQGRKAILRAGDGTIAAPGWLVVLFGSQPAIPIRGSHSKMGVELFSQSAARANGGLDGMGSKATGPTIGIEVASNSPARAFPSLVELLFAARRRR